jgi:quaternary ammonium compound-resistance protein SugE
VTASQAWFYLIASGVADVGWDYATKRSEGFTRWEWAALSLALLALFIVLLVRALKVLPLGLAYAVWTGVGAVGAMVVGVVAFHEPIQAQRLAFAAVVVVGVIGLKLSA